LLLVNAPLRVEMATYPLIRVSILTVVMSGISYPESAWAH
jgi:hypothetical protein